MSIVQLIRVDFKSLWWHYEIQGRKARQSATAKVQICNVLKNSIKIHFQLRLSIYIHSHNVNTKERDTRQNYGTGVNMQQLSQELSDSENCGLALRFPRRIDG